MTPADATDHAPAARRPAVILDTDLGGDVDDLGALAALHALADLGRLDILGVVSDTPQRHAVGAIDAVDRWFGRGHLPVGRPELLEVQSTYADAVYQAELAAGRPSLDGADAPPAVPLMRRLLAGAGDGSVVLVGVGVYFHLNALLDSPPDDASPLPGRDLVADKVGRAVIMGGEYPRSGPVAETNFRCWHTRGVARRFVERCPAPIDFVGVELGHTKLGFGTGARIGDLPADHPVRVGYADFFRRPPAWTRLAPSDRIAPWSIWDQIAVYAALGALGPAEPPLRRVRGLNRVDDAGHNDFEVRGDGPHAYLELEGPPEAFAAEVIEPLMVARPLPRR